MAIPIDIIDEIFAEPKKRKKAALNELFDKYGTAQTNIDNMPLTDWYTYLMNRDVENEVRAERQQAAAHSQLKNIMPNADNSNEVIAPASVEELKSSLANLGYYSGDIDDVPTPGFNKAMNDFMTDYHIEEADTEAGRRQISQTLRGIKNPSRIDFDGKNLRWVENGKVLFELEAQSGRSDYQDRQYQSLKGKGPLPEGSYRVRQQDIQDIEDSFLERIGRGRAPGGYKSWGKQRVWLQPFASNTMYDRDKLSIHGGEELGSAGCIDLGKRDERFFNVLKKYGKDVILNVRYPRDKLR